MNRLTSTRDDSVVNRANVSQIKLLAFEQLFLMNPDAATGWKHFNTIMKWTGKHTVMRVNKDALTLEIV